MLGTLAQSSPESIREVDDKGYIPASLFRALKKQIGTRVVFMMHLYALNKSCSNCIQSPPCFLSFIYYAAPVPLAVALAKQL